MPVQGSSVVNKAKRLPPGQQPPPKRKVIYSNFFVTISTNYRARSQQDFDRFNDRFAEVLEQMTSSAQLGYFVDFKQPKQTDTWDEPFIHNYRVETNIEEGTDRRGGHMHCHMLLEVQHQSKIQLNRNCI